MLQEAREIQEAHLMARDKETEDSVSLLWPLNPSQPVDVIYTSGIMVCFQRQREEEDDTDSGTMVKSNTEQGTLVSKLDEESGLQL